MLYELSLTSKEWNEIFFVVHARKIAEKKKFEAGETIGNRLQDLTALTDKISKHVAFIDGVEETNWAKV